MKSRVLAALSGAVLALGLAGAAQAQIRLDRPAGGGGGGAAPTPAPQQQAAGVIERITPEVGARLLQQVGFKGNQTFKTDGGLTGLKMEVNGTPVIIGFVDCKPEGCASFIMLTNFGKQQISSDFINTKNANMRFARIYIMEGGDAVLHMDGQLYGGISPANFAVHGAIFASALKTVLAN